MSRLVVASLGTDHHPFDRVVDWLDAAAVRRPDCEILVQHGHSRAPLAATGRDFLGHDELLMLLRRAHLVVCHGGPGTLMDAREAGHVPIMVPRDPRLGEHVDRHQLRFAEAIDAHGMVEVATERDTFDRLVDARLSRARLVPRTAAKAGGASGMAALVAELERLPVHPHRITPVLRSMRRAVQR